MEIGLISDKKTASFCMRVLDEIDDRLKDEDLFDDLVRDHVVFFKDVINSVQNTFIDTDDIEMLGMLREQLLGIFTTRPVLLLFEELSDYKIELGYLQEHSRLFSYSAILIGHCLIAGINYCREYIHKTSLSDLDQFRDMYQDEIGVILSFLICKGVSHMVHTITDNADDEDDLFISVPAIPNLDEINHNLPYPTPKPGLYNKLFWDSFFIKDYLFFGIIILNTVKGMFLIDIFIKEARQVKLMNESI